MIRTLFVFLALLLSCSLRAQTDIDCTFKYRMPLETDIRICSYEPISKQDLTFISNVISDIPESYYKYLSTIAGRADLKKRSIERVDIALLSLEALNDGTLPSGFNRNNDVVGRYYPGERRVYVTLDSIKNTETVLVHEVVHLMNSDYNISNRDIDENLAYAFEEFWINR